VAAPGVDATRLIAVLCELARVERLADLGTRGPLVASAGQQSLFNCLFGRDSLRMARDLLDNFPVVARATLLDLARLQGVVDNPRAEEEPGRIVHEHRFPDDPHAVRLATHWDFPYYGAVDSTPEWINLLVAYCARYGNAVLDEVVVDRLWRRLTLRDGLLAALGWLLRRLENPIGAGFLWVRRASADGIPNQVWEDSPDSYYHADGRLLDFTRPYAPIAPQGYAFDALMGAAALLDAAPDTLQVDTEPLRRRARALRTKVLSHFWQADLGTFALALDIGEDGSLQPARVVASSPGHLLASQLLDGDDVEPLRRALAERLLADDMLAGAGVRTKSSGSARFNPGSYHNGSTWPMDTGVIADGLSRHGYATQARDLEDRILHACGSVGGFPEFFRGETDGSVRVNRQTVDVVVNGVVNRIEQPPQANQGWTATRVWRILSRRSEVSSTSRAYICSY
jgi:glycogen debranching enzyme